jgi:hypothetical protein
MSYPVARSSATTQVAQAAGGLWPGGASAVVPESTTTATRLRPSTAAVPAQTAAKSGVVRGGWSPTTAVIENRQPSTVPSAGIRKAGPTDPKDHDPSPIQYVQ